MLYRSATFELQMGVGLLCMSLALGCGGSEGSKGFPDVGAPPLDRGGIDVAQPVPQKPGVLLLDFDMRPYLGWRLAMETLDQLGYPVTYRRWFPHVTKADIALDAETGAPTIPMIFVAAGSGPALPTEVMRSGAVELLVAYVQSGGVLVLLPRNGWSDTVVGEGEWLLFNRLLETLELPLRIERNTVIGHVSLPQDPKPPLHSSTAAGYPGTLEWTLNLPVIYTALEHEGFQELPEAFAGGYLATLACNGDGVSVFARTHEDAILWWHHQLTDDQLSYAVERQPVAALVQAGAGAVAILPRSLLHIHEHSNELSDKPVLDPTLLSAAATVMEAALSEVVGVRENPDDHVPQGCKAGRLPLFSAVASGLDPLGSGPLQRSNLAPSTREVPDLPPVPPEWAAPLAEQAPNEDSTPATATPQWFSAGGARLAYGELAPAPSMTQTFQRWVSAGMDSFVVRVEAEHLSAYVGAETPPPFGHLGDAAQASGAQVYLGVHYVTAFSGNRERLGRSVGAHGLQLDMAPPLEDAWWEASLRSVVLGAARFQRDHPEVGGLLIDTELYGSGALGYHQGQAYDPDTWSRVVNDLKLKNEAMGTEAEALPLSERMTWLVDHGLLGAAYGFLEDRVALRAQALLEEARELSPGFEVALYMPMVSTDWFYRGLMRGFGAADRPLLLLTYDMATRRLREELARAGVHTRILGGVLAVLFGPEDVERALVNCGTLGDGYWLFQYGDFPDTDAPEYLRTKHGAPAAYLEAVKNANAILEAAPDTPQE